MQHTLVAVFDNRSDAQQALEDLITSGFTRQAARLSEGDTSGVDADESIGSSIKHFFSGLFGSDRGDHAHVYSEAVKRGHYVLTLTADSEGDVDRAAGIVERYSPVDIDEQAQEWSSSSGSTGLRGSMGAGAQQQSAGMSQQFAVGTGSFSGGSVQGGGVQGGSVQGANVQRQDALQRTDANAIPVVQEELRVGKRELERSGVRIYNRVGETPVELDQLAPADDNDYRGHWDSNFSSLGGSYDDYAPAYDYGSTMARSDLYRGRPWNDVEPDLRTDWEARNPASGWEQFKAAVRHGWDRMTS